MGIHVNSEKYVETQTKKIRTYLLYGVVLPLCLLIFSSKNKVSRVVMMFVIGVFFTFFIIYFIFFNRWKYVNGNYETDIEASEEVLEYVKYSYIIISIIAVLISFTIEKLF